MEFNRMQDITDDQSMAVLTNGHQAIPVMVNLLNTEGVIIPCMRHKTAENVLHAIWEALRIVTILPGCMSLTVVDRVGTQAMMRHFHLNIRKN